MTDVAKRVNLTQIQTENLIQEMVDRKEIKAEIEMHENSRIVCFGTDDSKRKMLPQLHLNFILAGQIYPCSFWGRQFR